MLTVDYKLLKTYTLHSQSIWENERSLETIGKPSDVEQGSEVERKRTRKQESKRSEIREESKKLEERRCKLFSFKS